VLRYGLLTLPSFVNVSDGVTEMKLTREDKEGEGVEMVERDQDAV
jgi:hypothetical protein